MILLLRDHYIRNGPSHTTDEMVFGDFVDNNSPRDEASRLQALRAANCIKILGKGVIRVVHRVDDARENNTLGKPKIQFTIISICPKIRRIKAILIHTLNPYASICSLEKILFLEYKL